jgi:hypothetical protein
MLRQNQLMGEVTLISPGSATVSLPFDCSAWVPSLCFKIPDSGPTAYGFLIAYISTGPNRLNIYCLNSSGGSVPGSAGATVAWTLTEPY